MSILSEGLKDGTLLLGHFDSERNNLKNCGDYVRKLIETMLLSKNISIHKIELRIKERTSLEKKFKSNPDKYAALFDITDIIGVRIITFFPDEVDIIGRYIEVQFEIDPVNSIDKRSLEYDKFGYSSLHYVASFKEERLALLEYQGFKGFKFEIQIRSILQHAWAEIEHDLGYKGDGSMPVHIKRRFARLAALLEIGDLEFESLRKTIQDYTEKVEADIKDSKFTLPIDQTTLKAYVDESPLVREIFEKVQEGIREKGNLGSDLTIMPFIGDKIEKLIGKLKHINIHTIDELNDALVNIKTEMITKYIELSQEFAPINKIAQELPVMALIDMKQDL